jgi:hypothetical protein
LYSSLYFLGSKFVLAIVRPCQFIIVNMKNDKQTIILIDSIHNKKIVVGDIDKTQNNEFTIDIDNTYDNKETFTHNKESSLTNENPSHAQILFTAHRIALILKDDENFPFYYKTVKELGLLNSIHLLHETQDDMLAGENSHAPIHNPAALFNWKVQNFRKNHKKV